MARAGPQLGGPDPPRSVQREGVAPHLGPQLTLVAVGAILVAFASLGYRAMRTTQMVTQYGWLYERTSPLSWRDRTQS